MNDEIKEILDRIDTASEIFDCLLKPEECTELIDYITNLQQENERLKEDVSNLSKVNPYKHDCKIYKSRCEKASEYIKEHWVIDEPIKFKNDLLNILQNGNDSQ